MKEYSEDKLPFPTELIDETLDFCWLPDEISILHNYYIHQHKLSKKLSLEPSQFLELKHLATRQIRFIEEERISSQNWNNANELTKIIDSDDIAFVALSLELNCPLWTGDKRLSKSLTEVKTLQTYEIYELLQ